jgi:hypothetical protein
MILNLFDFGNERMEKRVWTAVFSLPSDQKINQSVNV